MSTYLSDEYIKREDETEDAYVARIVGMKAKIGRWSDVAEILNENLHYNKSEDCYRKRADRVVQDSAQDNDAEDEPAPDTTESKLRGIQKERIKFQTEKLEYNRWLRTEARDELICEKIVNAIKGLPRITVSPPRPVIHTDRTRWLFFGDEHFGKIFTIYGLFGEILNEYSPEIFYARMEQLLDEVCAIVRDEKCSLLKIGNMGDFSEGIIRVKQLMKLRYGVIEGAVKYAEYMAQWYTRLSGFVNLEIQMVHGNHTELRLLGEPKGTFTEENTGRFVYEMLKARLENNPNITMKTNPTGLIFDQFSGLNMLGIHGEVKDMEKALKDFMNLYRVLLNVIVGGHLHHSKSETVGLATKTLTIPSIMGVDDFALDLHKASDPGATFAIFEPKGLVEQHNILLN